MALNFQVDEATAAQRRFPLYLVDAADGITAETGEAAGQPQVSKNGAAFGNTSATLTAIGNGSYYVELTAGELDTIGMLTIRYKSAATAEFSLTGQVVSYDPYSATNLGLSNLDAAISSRSDFDETANPVEILDSGGAVGTSAAELVDDIWDEDATGHQGAGTFGETVGDSAATGVTIHARVNQALPAAAPAGAGGLGTVDAGNLVAGIQGAKNDFDDLNDVSTAEVNTEVDLGLSDIRLDELISATAGGIDAVIGSLLDLIMNADGGQTFAQGTDSLEALAAASAPSAADNADAVWDEDIVAAHGGADSAGLLLRALGALISQRANNPTLNALLGVADAAGEDVPSTATDEVWDEDATPHQAAGSFGGTIGDQAADPDSIFGLANTNLDATVSSRSDFDETTDPVELLDAGGAIGTSAAELVDDIWDEAQAGHVGAGTFGLFLDAIVSGRAAAGDAMALTVAAVDDIWDEDIVAAHGGADSAGLLLRALGALISQRANNATLEELLGVADAVGRDIPEQIWLEGTRDLTALGFQLDTADFVAAFLDATLIAANAIGASQLATDAGQEIADRLLARSLATGADGGRTVQDALRAIRNRKEIAAAVLTVYEEDDATPAWTAAVTTAASDPISEIDPA